MVAPDHTIRTRRWWPDEVAHAGRENLDPRHVALYDDKEDARAADDVALLRDRGLQPWLLEPMIERSGFRIEQADHSADGTLAAYVARAV